MDAFDFALLADIVQAFCKQGDVDCIFQVIEAFK
jgi:hypothetical protein